MYLINLIKYYILFLCIILDLIYCMNLIPVTFCHSSDILSHGGLHQKGMTCINIKIDLSLYVSHFYGYNCMAYIMG